MPDAAPLRATIRHLVAWVGTTIAGLVLWTATYVALFLWAIFAEEALGSPIVWPLGLLLTVLIHTGATLFIFLPATLGAELICRREKLPKVRGGLALAFSFFLVILAITSGFVLLIGGPEAPTFLESFLSLLLLLAIPMGAYWWTSQFPSLVHLGVQKLFPKSSPPNQNLPS